MVPDGIDTTNNRRVLQRTKFIGLIAVAISVAMRLPLARSPLSVDEGGYLAIARAWGHGRVLYRDLFIDRPQGLLALFRVWDWASGGSGGSVRIMAMLFGAGLVIATGVIVAEVAGPVAARAAMIVCAVISAAPVLEGHEANAELLSCAPSAAALALALTAHHRTKPSRAFFAAGLFAAAALSIKQSGFDGLLTIATWLAITAMMDRSQRRTVMRHAAWFIAGASVVAVMLAVHGALTGWSRWWDAVAGYRLRTQSAFASADWANLARTARYGVTVMGAVALLAVIGLATIAQPTRRRRSQVADRRSASLVPVFWFGWAIVSFIIGGGFWRHYWLLLAAPLSALAGIGVQRLRRCRSIVTAIALVPALAISAWVFVAPEGEAIVRATGDSRTSINERISAWFDQHRSPHDSLYVLCASAALYADADVDPGYPYLWFVEVRNFPGAGDRLVRYLEDPSTAPRFVAEYQPPSNCEPSGRVEQTLTDHYRPVAVVSGVQVLERLVA